MYSTALAQYVPRLVYKSACHLICILAALCYNVHNMAKPLDADVLVVGAGPAGSTTAYLLARQGGDVLLVDRSHFPRPRTCGDGLIPRAVAALQRLGLLPQLLKAGYPRVEGARILVPLWLVLLPGVQESHWQGAMSPGAGNRKIDPALTALRQADPQATVVAIVRTEGAAEAHRVAVEGRGLTVRRVFRLLPGLAVEGKVAAVLDLADHPWVKSVSLDREVHVMRER